MMKYVMMLVVAVGMMIPMQTAEARGGRGVRRNRANVQRVVVQRQRNRRNVQRVVVRNNNVQVVVRQNRRNNVQRVVVVDNHGVQRVVEVRVGH